MPQVLLAMINERKAMLCPVFVFVLSVIAISDSKSAGSTDYSNCKFNQASQQEVRCSSHSSTDWLFARPRQSTQLNASESALDAKLKDVLDRVGPDMKPASGFRDYDDISIDVAKRAWQLLHERVRDVSNERIVTLLPQLEHLLTKSNVSGRCMHAVRSVADGARSLDVWATQCKLSTIESLLCHAMTSARTDRDLIQ